MSSQLYISACALPQYPYIGDLTNSENDLPNVVMLGHCVLSTSKFIYGSVNQLLIQCNMKGIEAQCTHMSVELACVLFTACHMSTDLSLAIYRKS